MLLWADFRVWVSGCAFLPQQCCGEIGCVDVNAQSGQNSYSEYITNCGGPPVSCTFLASCSYNETAGTCHVDYQIAAPDIALPTSTASPAVDMTTDYAPSTSTATPAVDITTDHAQSTSTATPVVDITTDYAPSTATVEQPCEYCPAFSTPATII